jgi:hypothetical protein
MFDRVGGMTLGAFRFTARRGPAVNAAPPLSPARTGWAVRRDWPVDGTHEFICLRRHAPAAARQAARDAAYWRMGPVRPELCVVEISEHEFWLHARARRDCRAPDCADARPGRR